MRPNIGDHDLNVKVNHIKEFLEDHDKVRVSIQFRGRENAHRDLGFVLAERIRKMLEEVGDFDHRPSMMGNRMIINMSPKKIIKPAGAKQKSV